MRSASILALIAVASAGFGQTYNLTAGAANSWNTAGNWTPSGVPNGIGASATFVTPTAAHTVNLNAAITVGSLNFTNNATTFIQTLANGTGGSLIFDVASGNATVVTNGTNATTNNVVITATTTLNDTLQFTVNNVAGVGAGTATMTGAVSGSGGFIKDGLGRFTFSTAAKTYTGATIVNQGRLRFTATGTATGTSSVLVNSGGQLNLDSTAGAFAFGAAGITLNGAGTTEAAQFQGALRSQGSGASTLANAVTLATDSTIHSDTGTASLQINGALGGTGALTKTGGGNLILNSASNTHTGDVIVNNGAVTYNAGSALGGGRINLAQSTTNSTLLRINSNQTAANLTTTWTDTSGTLNQTINLGTLATTVLTVNQTTNTTFGNGAVPTLTGVITGSGQLALSATSAASLTLTGANTYTGGTTIDGGKLLANNTSGSATGTGAVAVNAAGTLGGSGTVAGSVTMNGGTLSPGNSPGNLTLGGLTMNSGTYLWELGALTTGAPGVDHDLLTVNGAATLGGSSALQIAFTGTATDPNAADPFWAVNHQWLILDASAGSLTGTLGAINNPTWTDGLFSLSTAGNQLFLNWTFAPTAIPEPGSLALLALAGLGALAWRRRPAARA